MSLDRLTDVVDLRASSAKANAAIDQLKRESQEHYKNHEDICARFEKIEEERNAQLLKINKNIVSILEFNSTLAPYIVMANKVQTRGEFISKWGNRISYTVTAIVIVSLLAHLGIDETINMIVKALK